MKKKINVLITGVDGLLGKKIRKYFIYRQAEVTGIDIKKNSILEDINNINKIFRKNKKIDLIVNCASYCRINKCISNPKQTFKDNIAGTFEVFEYARKNNIKKIITFSSSRVLSKEKNIYTTSKIFMEELAKSYKECYGIDYIIIRPSTVFGLGDNYDRIIPKFIKNALNNEDLKIYGDKNKTLDINDTGSFMKAFKLIIDKGNWNETYNISNNREIKVDMIAKFIINATDSKSKIKYSMQELAQPQKVKVDNSKIVSLGYKNDEIYLFKYLKKYCEMEKIKKQI